MGIHFPDTIGLYRLHLSQCRQGSLKHRSTFNKTFSPSSFFPFFSLFFLVENTSLFTAPAVGGRGRGCLQLASTDCAASSLVGLTAHRLPHFSESLVSLSCPARGHFCYSYSCFLPMCKVPALCLPVTIGPCVFHPLLLNSFL